VTGRIVFTCQVFKVQASNQICLINANGTGFQRLTGDSTRQHFYPSWAPEGQSVVFSVFREANIYEIHEMTLVDGDTNQLTDKLGVLTAPEVSPDGRTIAFSRWTPTSDRHQIWLMDRDGSDVRNVPRLTGWDPTWSPDGSLILFASDESGAVQLFTVREDGKGQHQVSDLPAIRGRSDWSPNGEFIVTYSGESWHREVYLMNADGSNAHQISPGGGNAQGPSISPDGQWVAFTAYYDRYGDDHGCEIYIMRIDGSNLRRVTNNDYCDYQPRWGP
jgi:TolB protein